ncbi:MAG: hypothetical protein QXF58_04855 [Desulfurococcaceae archaeon]
MIIKGIHYGLTLLYSYHLPLFDIEETNNGFIFKKAFGSLRGIECVFNEKDLETICESPHRFTSELSNALGLDRLYLFKEICGITGIHKCIAENITLIHNELDKQLVFYTIYLSRNTDYYVNTVRWVQELLRKGYISSNSYIARDFMSKKDIIDEVYSSTVDRLSEIVRLLSIHGVGVKSIKAYLLHAYGDTVHAPIDRYYARFLGQDIKVSVDKNRCLKRGLNCERCSSTCPYAFSMERFNVLNGVVQSLVYIYNRLRLHRRSRLEEILVKDPSVYLDGLEHLIKNLELIKYP